MVKSYTRFELDATFGIISSASPPVHLPSSRGPGRVVVGADEAVQIWDLKTSQLLLRLVDPQQSEKAQVVQLAYEKNAEIIAAGYTDGSIRIWDTRSSTVVIVFNGHKSYVSKLEFSRDGTQLISGGADTTVIVWDLINEQGLYRLKGHKAPITAIVPLDDNYMVTVSKDGVMKLWDLKTQFCTETRMAHKGECWEAALIGSQNNGDFRIATVGNGTELKVWSLDSNGDEGHQISSLGELQKEGRHRGVGLKFDFANNIIVCASGDIVQSWRLRTPDEIKRLLKRRQKRASKKKEKSKSAQADAETNADADADAGALTIADEYAPFSLFRTKAKITGLCLYDSDIIVNLNTNSIEYWDQGEEPQVNYTIENSGHRTDIRDCCISSDGRVVATGSNGTIKLHNAHSTAVIRTLTDTGYILALRFLPGDQLIVAGTKEGNLDLYDIAKASKIGTFPAHAGAVWSIDVSSDGKQIVSGGADKSVKFWSLELIEEPVPGHPDLPGVKSMSLKNTHKLEFNDDVLAVKLSPDMQLVAASLLDNTVKVYKTGTLKFYLNLYGHQLPVLSLDISHDNKLLVTSSADKNIKLWGLDFGDCHKSIFAHDDSVLRVVFEPQSYNFLSASKDGLVKYWDGAKFIQIQALKGHHSEVWALAMAYDGTFAVSASHDKTIRIWQMTDEPLFVEEERELEMEQEFEENIAHDLNREDNMDDEDQENTVEEVKKHTIESLKAGERLFEALDICVADLQNVDNKPRHVILTALNVSPEKYLMDTLSRIKTPLVEDALLTFPLDKIVGLLQFVEIWLEKKWNPQMVCRVLFFCLRSFSKQIIATKMLQSELEVIRERVRSLLNEIYETIGFNLASLKMLQAEWDENHVRTLDLDADPVNSTQKRVYESISL